MRAANKRRARKRTAGMTLIEIMIVVVIMGMIAAVAGFGVMNAKKEVDLRTAKTDVHNLASIAEGYMLQHAGSCPSMGELKDSGLLRRGSHTADPWETEYVLLCDSGEVNVRSAGPDRQLETEDDIKLF